MKLAPIGPTFLQERDAIIAAAQAGGSGADVSDLWAGFAIRGMGFSARVTAPGAPAVVVEAFDLPNLLQTPAVTVSDSTGDNDGFPEPGETITINVPLTNNTGSAATGVTLQVVGGGSANYGTINNGQTVTQAVTYTVPAGTLCGSSITLTFNVNSSLGATSFTHIQATFTQNFDGAVAPAFPAGWTATSVQSGITFVNSTLNADTAPNSAFALDPATVGGGTDLISPSIAITAQAATVSFRNRFDTEGGWDGGVLEISINGGAYADIITAGGRFVENGYNGALGAGANNPLANRNAWSGNSSGYITSTVQLPAAAAGQNVQLKWRFGADDNTVGTGPNPGWYVDTVRVNGNYSCSSSPIAVKSRADFDGDGKTDLSVFRSGTWYANRSTDGFLGIAWGLGTDKIVPADYDSDGKTDTAVFRATADPTQPDFYILNSAGFTVTGSSWGITGDIPVVADYDGDGKADVAVYRPSSNIWFVLKSGGGISVDAFGQAGDVPVAGNFAGSNLADRTLYRSSTNSWVTQVSGGGVLNYVFGSAGDVLVPADYDNDNIDDRAVYRPSTGVWYVLKSTDGTVSITQFGAASDIPVPGDYDGDGRDDIAIYRNGEWWLNRSTAGITVQFFGLPADLPIAKGYIP